MKLQNTHVLVTGGASGLGEACVRRAVADGARVSIFDLAGQAEAAAALAKELGGEEKLRFFAVDIVSEDSVAKGLAGAIAAFGALRVVINCAGTAAPCRVISSRGVTHPQPSFDKVLAINLSGTFNVLRQAAAIMAKQDACAGGERGCFVNVASVAAFEGQIGQAAYAASKGGVVAMTLPIARELAEHGLRINTVAPGIFNTAMLAKLPEKVKASLANQVPFPKRLGEPAEFADCCSHYTHAAHKAAWRACSAVQCGADEWHCRGCGQNGPSSLLLLFLLLLSCLLWLVDLFLFVCAASESGHQSVLQWNGGATGWQHPHGSAVRSQLGCRRTRMTQS